MQNVVNSKYDRHIIKNLYFFKYSAKRQGLLDENITQIYVESSKKKLVKVKRDGLPDMMLCEYVSNCIKQYLKNVRNI